MMILIHYLIQMTILLQLVMMMVMMMVMKMVTRMVMRMVLNLVNQYFCIGSCMLQDKSISISFHPYRVVSFYISSWVLVQHMHHMSFWHCHHNQSRQNLDTHHDLSLIHI